MGSLRKVTRVRRLGTAVRVAGILGLSMNAAFAAEARAHTVLVDPTPLSAEDSYKTEPCGCTFGGDQPCDADYAVTEYEIGETITVTWDETIQHTGDFRVSFAKKSPETVTETDFATSAISETIPDVITGGNASLDIVLPMEPCESCTIQVRQFMEGADSPYYYTCAAIRIVDPGATGTGGGGTGGAPGTGGGSEGGQGGGINPGAGGSDPQGSGGIGGEPVWAGPETEDGCSASGAPASSNLSLMLLGALGLSAAKRRRR